jgi:rubrerythrin
MPDARSRLLTPLRDAIIAERAGNAFYEAASRNTPDPKGRETFLLLAAEEALHEKYLREQYALVSAGAVPSPLIDSSGAIFDARSPIFTPELKERIGTAHWEMTALSVGMQLEENSIRLYRRLSQESEAPEFQHFFEKLARWEEGHATALRRQYHLLLESYWQEARFAPF